MARPYVDYVYPNICNNDYFNVDFADITRIANTNKPLAVGRDVFLNTYDTYYKYEATVNRGNTIKPTDTVVEVPLAFLAAIMYNYIRSINSSENSIYTFPLHLVTNYFNTNYSYVPVCKEVKTNAAALKYLFIDSHFELLNKLRYSDSIFYGTKGLLLNNSRVPVFMTTLKLRFLDTLTATNREDRLKFFKWNLENINVYFDPEVFTLPHPLYKNLRTVFIENLYKFNLNSLYFSYDMGKCIKCPYENKSLEINARDLFKVSVCNIEKKFFSKVNKPDATFSNTDANKFLEDNIDKVITYEL